MSEKTSTDEGFQYYSVWDRTTILFHWINVICVVGLVGVGVVILNYKTLGVHTDGKILLKTIHAYIGYVFVINLSWRIVWGFIGNKFARWRAVLPIEKGFFRSLKIYVDGVKAGDPPQYAGHNPLARLMVAFLFLLLTAQAITGLTLAGTDLYLPPFGHEIAEWVSASGEDHKKLENLKAGYKDGIDSEAYAEMREFRKPFITVHKYTFYLLLICIFLHIAAVVVTEIREKNGLVSAMFTGKKVAKKKPIDLDN